jgi:hypothetical protein
MMTGTSSQKIEKAISAEEAKLADMTLHMERELGQQACPEGLMALWPGAPWHEDIRLLFAVQPPGTVLLIAVLEGPEAVQDQYPEAVRHSPTRCAGSGPARHPKRARTPITTCGHSWRSSIPAPPPPLAPAAPHSNLWPAGTEARGPELQHLGLGPP